MSYGRRLLIARQIYRNFSSNFINPSSNPLSKTCSRTISSSIVQNQTKWSQNQKTGIRIMGRMVISCGNFGSLVYNCWDTVPYCNRTCRVFFPRRLDTSVGDIQISKVPIPIIEEHPDIDRLRSILTHILEAAKAKNKHIGSLSWEVFVVDGKSDLAWAVPNGKIFISKQLLKDFTTDAEIATAMGHEVAHVLARHKGEMIALLLVSRWIPLQVARLCITDPQVLELGTMEDILYYYRQQGEFEADYIGMMLMASAGYDPKSAPEFYLKIKRLYGEHMVATTHPHYEHRAKKLIQVMEEASTIYNSCSEKRASLESRNCHPVSEA